MRVTKFFWLLGFLAAVSLGGCATRANLIRPVLNVEQSAPPKNQEAQVRPGAMMMQVTKGGFWDGYKLSETVEYSFLGNSCTLSPQTFLEIQSEGQFRYAVSSKDFVDPAAINSLGPYLRTCACVLKFNPGDLKATGIMFKHANGGAIEALGPGSSSTLTESPPVLQPVPQVNIFSSDFYRKTVRFDSFSDDYLNLRIMEERGVESGYDRQNNYKAPPPEVSERLIDFDLQASKTIYVEGAEIEVVSAGPSELVYKVVTPMSVE